MRWICKIKEESWSAWTYLMWSLQNFICVVWN